MTTANLTAHQQRLLRAASSGLTIKEMASLYARGNPNTITAHLSKIYRKLGVHSLREALREYGRLSA